MTKKLRVGIISANWGAIAHLPSWRSLDNVEVTAMCTSRQETALAAAEKYNIDRPFWDYEAMCNDPDIDIIDMSTSPLQREAMATAALNGGKHVMNNMPFAASLAGAQKLVDLSHAKGLKGSGAASMVGLPHIGLMKEMIEQGDVGEVFQVHVSWQMGFFLNIYQGFSYTWFGTEGNGTSVTRNQSSHMLNLLYYVLGCPVTSVCANIKTQLKTWNLPDGTTMNVETDDTSHTLLNFANGAMGTMSTSWTACDSPGFSLEVFGSKGRLKLEALAYPSAPTAQLFYAKSQITHAPTAALVEVPERFFTIDGKLITVEPQDKLSGGQRISLARLFSGFAKGITDGGDYPITFDRCLEVQAVIAKQYESSAARAWVDV